jgi:hypothetical protein
MPKKFAVIQFKRGREHKVSFNTKEEAESFKEECLKRYPDITIEIKEVE